MVQIEDILRKTLENLPPDWLRLTTHRLDIYNEKLAKTEFLDKFENLNDYSAAQLSELPTAFDYIRLGHPLSCLLEWALAKSAGLSPEAVMAFSSQMMPLLAILRKNKFLKKKTRLVTTRELPSGFNIETICEVYDYDLVLETVDTYTNLKDFEGSTVAINHKLVEGANFTLALYPRLGSVVYVVDRDQDYINEIQHVRRRESIAMTPHNSVSLLKGILGQPEPTLEKVDTTQLEQTIKNITHTQNKVALGSSGLSIQYAIMMGLIHHANEKHPGHKIKFIVPPNCYGGTNDQARRVAACLEHVEIVDLPVDNGKDMVVELERILDVAATIEAVPYIIAEIPTNPRVEIPDLARLRETLKRQRNSAKGNPAIAPVFILDQTFCPNVVFFGANGYLHDVSALSYVSGSKFPSGGLCTAGYCVSNSYASQYMGFIQKHLKACDNEATPLQLQVLTDEMPSMNRRIAQAYENTRAFVEHIEKTLPDAKINFVSKELAEASFTPSVFSLDLPSQGDTADAQQVKKNERNHRLIQMMIEAIPHESKHCVSYGQLKGSYWTIPATSTQGTTKESDKDYIVRVSVAADFDLEKHKAVFTEFCKTLD